jgi:hypothetical protein
VWAPIHPTPEGAVAPIKLIASGTDEFRSADGPFTGAKVRFHREPDGTVAWLDMMGRVFPRRRPEHNQAEGPATSAPGPQLARKNQHSTNSGPSPEERQLLGA